MQKILMFYYIWLLYLKDLCRYLAKEKKKIYVGRILLTSTIMSVEYYYVGRILLRPIFLSTVTLFSFVKVDGQFRFFCSCSSSYCLFFF